MSLQTADQSSEMAILARILQPEHRELGPEEARYVLTLEFDQRDLDRMNELAAKAREGSLSSKEGEDLESYRQIGYLLAQMKARARIALKKLSS